MEKSVSKLSSDVKCFAEVKKNVVQNRIRLEEKLLRHSQFCYRTWGSDFQCSDFFPLQQVIEAQRQKSPRICDWDDLR